MQEKIFSMLLQENEITWQTILFDLVRTEQMDPWDISITSLTEKYIDMLKRIKTLDFRVTGKVVLAATILLKIKSKRFVDQDINEFNQLMAMNEEQEDYLYDEEISMDEIDYESAMEHEKPLLIPRTPQPRKRKVSIFDLIESLNKALEVQDRRVLNRVEPQKMEAPDKQTDISIIIKQVYQKIQKVFKKTKVLTFSKLSPSNAKEDVILTFIPLLHLDHMRKINVDQKDHFGEMYVSLLSQTKKG